MIMNKKVKLPIKCFCEASFESEIEIPEILLSDITECQSYIYDHIYSIPITELTVEGNLDFASYSVVESIMEYYKNSNTYLNKLLNILPNTKLSTSTGLPIFCIKDIGLVSDTFCCPNNCFSCWHSLVPESE